MYYITSIVHFSRCAFVTCSCAPNIPTAEKKTRSPPDRRPHAPRALRIATCKKASKITASRRPHQFSSHRLFHIAPARNSNQSNVICFAARASIVKQKTVTLVAIVPAKNKNEKSVVLWRIFVVRNARRDGELCFSVFLNDHKGYLQR